MPSIVNIENAVTELSLVVGAEQRVTFDVVNVSGHTLNVGVATTGANGEGAPSWATIEGDKTMKLADKDTRRIPVRVAPDAETKPGSYSFCLKVFDTGLPEVNNDRSDPVAVTVAAATPVVPPKKTPWALIIGLAAAVLVVAGVIAGGVSTCWFQGCAPEAPAEIVLPQPPAGATGEQAAAFYRERGLTTVTVVEDAEAPGKPGGLVLSVSPAPGATVTLADEITVRALSQQTNAPNLNNKVPDQATLDRIKASFDYKEQRLVNPDSAEGLVVAQSNSGMLDRGAQIFVVRTTRSGRMTLDLSVLSPAMKMQINPALRVIERSRPGFLIQRGVQIEE